MTNLSQVGSVHTTIFHDGEFQVVRYHSTPVVKFNAEKIILNTGGWWSNTTKNRMNQASNQYNLGYHVYQESGTWYVQWIPGGLNQTFMNRQIMFNRKENENATMHR